MKLKQTDRILDYIQRYGSISQLEALRDLSCMRLVSRICDLRRAGHMITGQMVTAKNRYGENVSYKRYSMEETAQ